jgi:hypothetical protein
VDGEGDTHHIVVVGCGKVMVDRRYMGVGRDGSEGGWRWRGTMTRDVRLSVTVLFKFLLLYYFLSHVINISSPTFHLSQRFFLNTFHISHYNHKISFTTPTFHLLSIFYSTNN